MKIKLKNSTICWKIVQYYEGYPKNKPEVKEFTSVFLTKTGNVDYLIKIRAAGLIENIKNYKSLNSYKIRKVSVEQVYRLDPDWEK